MLLVGNLILRYAVHLTRSEVVMYVDVTYISFLYMDFFNETYKISVFYSFLL